MVRMQGMCFELTLQGHSDFFFFAKKEEKIVKIEAKNIPYRSAHPYTTLVFARSETALYHMHMQIESVGVTIVLQKKKNVKTGG